MPPKAELARAGRRDLSKAVERWGGMEQLAALLHMEMPSAEQRRGSRRWRAHVASVAAQTGLGGTEVRPCTPRSGRQQKLAAVVTHVWNCRGHEERKRAAASDSIYHFTDSIYYAHARNKGVHILSAVGDA